MSTNLRPLVIALGLLAIWQAVVWLSGVPPFILPGPGLVSAKLVDDAPLLLHHAGVTLSEILLGMLLGTFFGSLFAISMVLSQGLRAWLLPLLVISQAIPVFALAPILVLWLGYGLASKVAMAALIIFFPVTAALLDGLRRADPGQLDLARTMGASRLSTLVHVQLPAALPAFASGLRVAAAVAPIGAVVGEWVGSSAGLGHLMLHASGRMQIDLMFAALLVLAVIAIGLYALVSWLGGRMTPWRSERDR